MNQPLFRNYGLFWKAENVFWGKQKNKGSLIGIMASAKTGKNVDFREQCGIYVLYSDFDIIYVGLAKALLSRLNQHRKDDLAERWDRFSWFGLRDVKNDCSLAAYNQATHSDNSDVLNHIEAILIHTIEPRLNRQGGKFGKNIQRYLQVRDKRLDD